MSIGVAVLVVMTPVTPVSTASASSSDLPPPDKTALIMGTSGIPTPDDFYVESVKNQFIAPTHPCQNIPCQNIDYFKVTTPEGLWPLAGLGRLIPLGAPEIFGVGGPGWDVPWWNLSGLFDLTLNQSILQGVTDLERAMAAHGNDDLVIYGYSQSAVIANREKRKLAEQYPAGTEAPDIDFVLGGDLNLPNGGLFSRFSGLYIPILDWSFNGPAPTETQFDTVEINRQYDFMGDFPLYPLNVIADLNAVLGFPYVHLYPFAVSLADDPTKSPAYQGKYGDTDYYFFETQDLPLFGPLRTLGVPEPLIDVIEPFFKVIVDLGYDRTIPPWEPTPARLIPPLNPVTVAADLVNAVGEGVNNALALTGSAPLLKIPAAGTSADTHGVSVVGSPDKVLNLNAVGDGIAHSLPTLNPVRTDQGNEHAGTDGETSEPPTPLGRWTKLAPKSLTDGFKFTPLKPRSSTADNQTGGPLATVGANIGHPLHQVGQNVETTIKKPPTASPRASAASIDTQSLAKADDIRSRVRQPRRSDTSETG